MEQTTEKDSNGQKREVTRAKVFFDHRVEVRAGDRIRFTDDAGEKFLIRVDGFRNMGGRGQRFLATGFVARPVA